MRSTLQLTVLAFLLGLVLTACGGNKNEKFDYKDPAASRRGQGLAVPPDLVSPVRDDRFTVPKTNTASAAAEAGADQASGSKTTGAEGLVRIERHGNQRWIVTRVPENTAWVQLRNFWKDLGFLLVKDDPVVGIMETEWAENRAKITQGDPLRRVLGNILGPVVSNGERDRYRTRIERTSEPGVIEIYVSHRGAEEMGGETVSSKTYWELRPANPELEAEMLQRIMVRLGANEKQAQQMLAEGKKQESDRASLVTTNGPPSLLLAYPLDRAWRQVGLALDRIGVVVEDRDRAKGFYFVRYLAAEDAIAKEKSQGWFSRTFSGSKKPTGTDQFRVEVLADGEQSIVRLLGKDGAPAPEVSARQILTLLQKELK